MITLASVVPTGVANNGEVQGALCRYNRTVKKAVSGDTDRRLHLPFTHEYATVDVVGLVEWGEVRGRGSGGQVQANYLIATSVSYSLCHQEQPS